MGSANDSTGNKKQEQGRLDVVQLLVKNGAELEAGGRVRGPMRYELTPPFLFFSPTHATAALSPHPPARP